MHIRFVFDGPDTMVGLSSEELQSYGLSPDEAVRVAVKNIERVYGKPRVVPATDGLMSVEGKSPDLNSSYFLDESFWQSLLKQHPEGLVVAVPMRGGLLFAPVSDIAAVDRLRKGIGKVYASSGTMRVSSALYVFKDRRWSVFQAPTPPK